MKKRQGKPFAFVLPLSALVVVIVLLRSGKYDALRSQIAVVPVELTVQHKGQLSFAIRQSTGKRDGIVEIQTQGTETGAITLPSSWQRREVRGAPLGRIVMQLSGADRTRWLLPPGVTLSLRVEEAPPLRIQNVSDTPLFVTSKRINVVTGKVDTRSILISRNGMTTLW
ncbi:hypothetical protein EXS70_05185 [Candidatus Peribacteria bacterium]|nr:hypothetical protein [Candidatus Peribacteria bacterium]